jgi:hypothetical protein
MNIKSNYNYQQLACSYQPEDGHDWPKHTGRYYVIKLNSST